MNHEFNIYKTRGKYKLSQGYIHHYHHREDVYTRDQIKDILYQIIDELCDYDNKKKWRDINFSLYRKLFHVNLHFPSSSKVNRIVLRVEIYKKK
jgi:hypothetical protein